jgi:hypothetical protein
MGRTLTSLRLLGISHKLAVRFSTVRLSNGHKLCRTGKCRVPLPQRQAMSLIVSTAVKSCRPSRGRLAPAFIAVVFGTALLGDLALAADPRIDRIELLNTQLVTIHFNTDANKSYELQFLDSLSCRTSVVGTNRIVCNTNGAPIGLWSNLFVAPDSPFPSHYVISDTRTNQQRFYRLRVTTKR